MRVSLVLAKAMMILGIDLMVFNTLKEKWLEDNNKYGENKSPDVMTLVSLVSVLPYSLCSFSLAPHRRHVDKYLPIPYN